MMMTMFYTPNNKGSTWPQMKYKIRKKNSTVTLLIDNFASNNAIYSIKLILFIFFLVLELFLLVLELFLNFIFISVLWL